jgi:tetratricopeptide (TPR) repeat protein
MIDRIAQKTRKGLKENTAHIQATSERVADVTTPNLEAYQQFFRGEQLIDKLEYKDAQKAYQAAIELDSRFALAHYRLAYANWWGGENEEVQRTQLQKALALVDRLPEKFRFLLRAQVAVNENGYEQGIEVLKGMETLYPDEKEMIYNIGDFSFHAKQYEQAEEYLLRVLEVEPNSQRALQHLAMTYKMTDDSEKAIAMAERYAESAQSDYAYITLSDTYLSEGDIQGALEVMEKARTVLPDNPWVRRRIAMVRCMNDEFDVARLMLDSLVTETDDIEVKRMGGSSLLGANLYMGRYREALETADHNLVLAEAEQDTVATVFEHQMKGIIHLFGWNDRESADAEIEQAKALQEVTNPDRFGERIQDYWANLMVYYFLTGEPDRARAIAENRLKSDAAQYDRYRFFRLWAAGDYEGAQTVAGDILEDKRKYDKTPVLFYLAKSQMEHGDYDRALEVIHELQEGGHYGGARPIFYAPSYYLLGQTFENKGDTKAAIENYEKFIAMWSEADPDIPILQDAKARLAELNSSSTQ